MIPLLFLACSSSTETAADTQNFDGPYVSSDEVMLSQSQEARWLVEYSNAKDVQFLFSSRDAADIQLSVFSADGDLLWSLDTQSPSNESYWIEPDCEGFCSFVAKSYVHAATDQVSVEFHILASTYDDVVVTSLP